MALERLPALIPTPPPEQGLASLWQATQVIYCSGELQGAEGHWADPWEELTAAVLDDTYSAGAYKWENAEGLPYFLALFLDSFQEVDLAPDSLAPQWLGEPRFDDDEEEPVRVGRPSGYLRQAVDVTHVSSDSTVFPLATNIAPEDRAALLHAWTDDDETWQKDIVRLEGDELVRWAFTTYQWDYYQSIEVRYRRATLS